MQIFIRIQDVKNDLFLPHGNVQNIFLRIIEKINKNRDINKYIFFHCFCFFWFYYSRISFNFLNYPNWDYCFHGSNTNLLSYYLFIIWICIFASTSNFAMTTFPNHSVFLFHVGVYHIAIVS